MSDDMICDTCHKESDSLMGGTTCKECYIPFEEREDFEYVAEGNTEGRIKFPEGICGICGKSTFQPYPTGLWIHQEDNDEKDEIEYSTADHSIRPATFMELILLENRHENRMGRGVGNIEWYRGYPEDNFHGDGKPNPYFEKRGVMKSLHTECLIHRKYWIKKSGKKQKEVHKLIGSVKPGFDRRYGDMDDLKDFLRNSERGNILQFHKFLRDDKIKLLDKNPKMPTIEYHFSINSRSGGINLTVVNEKKLSVIPTEGEKIKIDNKTYLITNIWDIKHHSPTKDIVSVYLRK